MSFNVNIPQGTDPIPQSYGQLRANFQAIASAFATNHAALTREAGVAGKHTVLTFQPLPPPFTDPATDATQLALYNKVVSTVPQIFFRPNSNQTPIQMTFESINVDMTNDRQQSFIAGPFVIYGGRLINPADGSIIVLTPASTLIHVMVMVTNNASFGQCTVTALAGSTFTLKVNVTDANPYDVFYFAVGI